MGHKKIRTALAVDLEKPAWEQPGLHVSLPMNSYLDKALMLNSLRIDGTPTVRQ